MEDDIICTEKIIAERKTFFLDLKQNARGKVVRITEKVSSNRDRIMVPAEILDDFIALPPVFYFTNSGAAAVPPFLSIRGIANPAGKKPFCLN